ncbi:ubiquinol-cytochrome c reductase complex 14 kDa protein [Talaromyces stipitatus ATCC 10500]|uniref:Cytochrome b-c1 complex subunit 7 n=1 Tax=Talaromyces stipitatus (strain ATCC 10500 / CBS 375.48 / QM 6759 / NRRL 1006) TaxID=441959 RepID=B8LTS5_TALSN|nr:ubiquinol-cytochrome c reductase complex 14 kDa protein [Talaromyces stipitatus ATCC 10500]EED23667.1 ubiquinol-cytochrome c reductase complex 14 kDa protein [Talaromyces stipitatus ATCC 10500]
MSVPSLTSYVVKRPYLKRWLQPIAEWYTNAAGYRRLGLRADDLIPEESELVQQAIKRLPAKEAYDRVFRLRRAFQCSISHTLLPAAEQTKPEEDVEYLSPIIRELQKEAQEREDLDNLIVKRK